MKSQYLILCFFYVANAAPLSQQAPKEMVDFMKRYGYLIDAGPDTDALYTKEAFSDAIKQMQRFGGVPETGVIDERTLKLLTSPRCGVKDVLNPSSLPKRTKRFVVGAEGWKKKTITYFVANWPRELSRETVMEKTTKAFEIWSRFSTLRFVHVNSTNADIILAFGRGEHGDGYPFDGNGNTLAHAFFPYDHDNYGGDAHFDLDEVWMDGSNGSMKPRDPSACCDYFTVAVHELGHSLGLAHSQVPGSIMFPYYKGYDPNFALDYDDIMAMYQMYIVNEPPEDEAPVTTEISSSTTSSFADYTTQRTSTTDDWFYDYNDDGLYTSVASPNYPTRSTDRFPEETPTETPDQDDKSKTDKPPFVKCNGSYDAISLFRSELFIFKGPYMWRLEDRAVILPSYPRDFRFFFYEFRRNVQKIDAVYERRTDYKVLFFTGKKYWIFDGYKFSDNSPLPLTHLGLPGDLESIDAAIVWEKNKKTYFFHGDYYWRYDEINAKMDDGYPQPITKWRGMPSKIDSAFTWRDGQTYFFKGNQYWRFNNADVMVDENFPQPASHAWLGCDDTSGVGCFNC